MLEAVTPRTKAVFLASPNNPTGRLIPYRDLRAFLERLPDRVLCVLDLVYWEYVEAQPEEDPHQLLGKHANLVILRTFSKVHGLAGLRIGYGLAEREVISCLGHVRIPFSTSTAAQVAARVSLEDHAHVQRSVELNRRARQLMARELQALDLVVRPSAANFLLVEFGCDSELLFQTLLRRGIVVRPMRHPRLAKCARITTGTDEQLAALFEALRADRGRVMTPPGA